MRTTALCTALLAIGLSACSDSSSAGAFGPGEISPVNPGTAIDVEVPAYSVSPAYTIHLWNSYHLVAEGSNIGTLNVQNDRVRVDILSPSNFQQINVPQSYGYIDFINNPYPPHTNHHTFAQINISGSHNIIDLSRASLSHISTSRVSVSGQNNLIIMPCHFSSWQLITLQTQPNTVRAQCY